MRKQRRMADLKDRQDRVRMGLIPPDPPKGSSPSGLLLGSPLADVLFRPPSLQSRSRT